ncbi:hypothetical protein [Arthrobacter sp. IK3]|uniref:hypothetical protein n=1 Tax=Arthrobacter sp. IK3 TaxID=3448169 RepID=UPI003EDFD056
MKKHLAAAALLSLLLTGCSGSADPGAPGLSSAAKPSASASPTPVSAAAPEPETLEEAILAAKADHTEESKAMSALADLRRFAEAELKPVMPSEAWSEIMVFEMGVELDMLSDRSTDREFFVGVQKYALMVEDAALEADLIR